MFRHPLEAYRTYWKLDRNKEKMKNPFESSPNPKGKNQVPLSAC
jgi:hypothetical protein